MLQTRVRIIDEGPSSGITIVGEEIRDAFTVREVPGSVELREELLPGIFAKV